MKDELKIVIAFVIYLGGFLLLMNALYAKEPSTHAFPVHDCTVTYDFGTVECSYCIDEENLIGLTSCE